MDDDPPQREVPGDRAVLWIALGPAVGALAGVVLGAFAGDVGRWISLGSGLGLTLGVTVWSFRVARDGQDGGA